MKIDGFLKIESSQGPIEGPSGRDGHDGEIEVYSIEYKMEAPHDPNSMTRRGRVQCGPVRFKKHYDKSSPLIAQACFNNVKIDEALFSARRTIDGETEDYLKVKLTNGAVVRYDLAPSPEDPDLIEEVIDFAYETIEFEYSDGGVMAVLDVRVGK